MRREQSEYRRISHQQRHLSGGGWSQGGSGAELFRQGQQDQLGGGGLWRERAGGHGAGLKRLYATDEAIRDGIDFYGLSGFSLVICKPDRKIIYSDCQWSSISEAGTLGAMVVEKVTIVASKRIETGV